MASGASSVNHSPSSTLVLKPIFGKGREERLSKFQEIIKDANPLYGSCAKWMKKAEERSDYKCRLLYQDKKPIGILMYHVGPSKMLESALTIKLLHADNLEHWNESHQAKLFEELINAAKDKNQKYLSAKIPLLASKTIAFFQNNDFSKSSRLSKENYAVFYRAVHSANQTNSSTSSSSSSSSNTKRRRSEREDVEKAESSDEEKDNGVKSHDPREKRLKTEKELHRTQSSGSLRPPSESSSSRIPGVVIPTIRRASEGSLPPVAPPRLTSVSIKKQYLHLIMNGSKTVEGRINSGMFARMKEGENVQFFCGDEKVLCQITALKRYSSFAEMLEIEGVQRCLPDVRTLAEGIRIYDSIPSFTQRARESGVVAIHLRKLA